MTAGSTTEDFSKQAYIKSKGTNAGTLEGQVLSGINNIYSVFANFNVYECRIKGKILRGTGLVYNPIAAGDFVLFEPDSTGKRQGMILERLDRRSEYSRWNKKRNSPQVIAANFDNLVVIASTDMPPFRPRFVDRILVMASGNTKILIVLNKIDNGVKREHLERMENYREIGYSCLLTSAEKNDGIEELQNALRGKTSVFAGQSGVGKSTLLNSVFPGLGLRTGEVSAKYNRGRHTTNYSRLLKMDDYNVIDTPGIREIEVFGISPGELSFGFPEFSPFNGKCYYPSCLHRDEPGCSVRDAVEEGIIHRDRYESYLRILYDLEERNS